MTPSRHHCKPAFTLVELCLGLGIMAFSLIAMIGLVPTGLGQLSTSIDLGKARTISQQVIAETKQRNYGDLLKLARNPHGNADDYYFSSDGERQSVDSPNRETGYTARVSLSEQARLPGDSSSRKTLLTVAVEVRKTPAGTDRIQNPAIQKFVGMVGCDDLSTIAKQ